MKPIHGALAFCTAALLASSAMAERYAILVGVDKYSFITEPTRQLRGAETDLSMMRRMLDFYGYKSTSLLRQDATRKRIVDELSNILKVAQSGDETVFYFSGRGAMAPDVNNPQAKTGWEPTLVPFDGSPTSLDPDIRIRRLEDWAKQLDTRGVHVGIILDCSFQNPTRSDFGRQYNPIPRSADRRLSASSEVRDKIYDGPGAFLSASPARGAAYEWLQNSSESRWSGAFTDQLVNSVVAAMNRGENPSYLDAMREAQAYFKDKVKADYMPGLAPQPEMPAMMDNAIYGDPAFGGIDVTKLPADSKAAMIAMDRIRAERERKFRVAIEIMAPAETKEREKVYGKASTDLQAYLKDRIVNSEFAPVGAPPDVIVQLRSDKNKLEATVVGDDLEKGKKYTYQGKDMRALLGSGLGSYIELRSLVSRLYRLTITESPTWKANLGMKVDQIALARGETFNLELSSDKEAFVFLLNRDDADGVLQLAFPQPGAPFSQKLAAPMTMGGTIAEDSSNGRMMLRGVIVPSQASVKIPDIDMMDAAKFRDALIRQLKVVVDGIEKKRLEWTVKTVNLRIR